MVTLIDEKDSDTLHPICWNVVNIEKLRFFLDWNPNHFMSKSNSYLYSWRNLDNQEKRMTDYFINYEYLFECKWILDATPKNVNNIIGKFVCLNNHSWSLSIFVVFYVHYVDKMAGSGYQLFFNLANDFREDVRNGEIDPIIYVA